MFALKLMLAAALAAPRPMSLYERLGGKPAIVAVVDGFVGRVAADPRVNRKVAPSDVSRLKFRLVQQLCHVTGGPCPDLPRSMRTVHRRMGVTDGEWDATMEDLVATLKNLSVPDREQGEILAILVPLKSEIVEVHSPATGTPLPPDFRPVNPLRESERREEREFEREHAK